MVFTKVWVTTCIKSSQLLWIFSVLADLNSVATSLNCFQNLHYFCLFSSFFQIVLRPLTLIGITVILMFNNFFSSLTRFRNLCSSSLFFSFTLWSAGKTKSTAWQVIFFFFTITCLWLLKSTTTIITIINKIQLYLVSDLIIGVKSFQILALFYLCLQNSGSQKILNHFWAVR